MSMGPGDVAARMEAITKAWKKLRPTKSFAGMTLDEFLLAIKPSVDARQAITDAEVEMVALQDRRDDADKPVIKTMKKIVDAVKGDVTEGPDGELYEAMGFVRDSERASGKTNKTKTTPPAP